MGVPKFFRYVSERYPCLSELVRENQVPEFDNLYLDMNGIIHNCSHPNDNDVHFRITEEQIFKDIFFYLETLFNMIKPQKLFFLAVDGVAPRAKMNQQRGRRFRSAKEAEVQEEKARQKGEVLPEEARFDSNCITPGTPFMCRLNSALRYFIQYKISTSKAWKECKVILSGHETPGEGEHKIMEYIRYLKAQKGFDPNSRHCLYGLDADLIMLGLCTHERHFSLLREEVKFGKKNNKAVSVTQQRFFLLHLSLLREYLEQEFIVLKKMLKFPFDIEKIIDDWVLMGFLVGNDFIPHIPNLHIHTNALPMLYDTYIKTLPSLDGYINEGGYLNLSRLQAYIENLAEFDRDNFASTFEDLKFLESKHQGAFNTRNTDTFSGNTELLDLIKATEFEFDSPEEEGDEENIVVAKNGNNEHGSDDEGEDMFEKEFHQHRRDYYVNKLKYEEMTPAVLKEQAETYITAIQWTLSYYYHGVQSWGYFYPHHYSPFISDLRNFKDMNIKFDIGKPFLPFQQLMSVLPAGSKDHVPECYKKLMTDPNSEIFDFYPKNFETDLNGKHQEWEAVVLIPFINEEKLLKKLLDVENELTKDEKARNVHGPMYVYNYSSSDQGMLSAPCNFPSAKLTCDEKKVFREETLVSRDKLILGPSKGAMLNVYFAGFPTMKHLNYSSELRLQHVKVFDQPSRGDNMIIVIKPGDDADKPLDLVVKETMGKIVFVGWPHLMEAKVVRISDKESTHFSDGRCDKTDPQKWRMDVNAIKEHHKNRMGIDVGEVERLIHVLQATGEEYKFDAKFKIFKKIKTWNKVEAAYPLQCVVSNVKAYRKKMQEELPLFEAFKSGTEVFMITNPYYGALGEVADTTCFEKSGRVKVMFTVPQEPNLNKMMDLNQKSKGAYMNSYNASSQVGISENVFNRITGSVLVIAGMKRQVAENQSRHNIGLQMKFTKSNEELVGFTKRDRIWLYSNKTVEVVRDYVARFPQIFAVMEAKTSRNNNDVYFETDFFPETDIKLGTEETFGTLQKWLKEAPSSKADRRQIGSESVEKEVIEAVSNEVKKIKDMSMKRISMQVKPHLLYAPSLAKTTTKSPDYQADFQLFDRVVVARELEQYFIGLKGTVIGITRIKDLNPVRQDCINREDVFCDILFDNDQQGRIAVENLINVSYGMSLADGNNVERGRVVEVTQPRQHQPPKLTESFSTILQNPKTQNGKSSQQAQAATSSSEPAVQGNFNFIDMWNALKSGNQEGGNENLTNVIKPTTVLPKFTDLKSIEGQKKQHDVINQKISSDPPPFVNKKKNSPVPNDQAVPIMINPPVNLPAPPIEWLQTPNTSANNFNNQPRQMHPQHPVRQAQFPMQQNPNYMQRYPIDHQNQRPIFPPQQFQRPMMQQPPPQMRQQQPQQHQQQHHYQVQQPMPYFPNNQPQYPQRCFFNSNYRSNNVNNPPKFNRQQSLPAQLQQQQLMNTSQHQNPFIPLQAARKSTKGKDKDSYQKPSKDVRQKIDEPKKQEVPNVVQITNTLATSLPQQSSDQAKKDAVKSSNPDTRKSRLAIKF